MATISLSNNKKKLFTFPNLSMQDEFIPVVDLDKKKFESVYDYGHLDPDTQEVTLSEHIDEKFRNITPRTVTMEERKFKLPFTLKKGCEKSEDADGVIEVKLSVSDPDITIVSQTKQNVKYGDSFEVEFDIKGDTDIEFYLEFYASDNDDGMLDKGELSDIHCGQLKVVFDYTVVTDWEIIAPVIPKDKFIGWGHPGVKENCFHYALEQLKQVGHSVKSMGWNKNTKSNKTKELNDHIYQLFLEQDVAGMKKGVQKNQFKAGVEYLKKALKDGIPVMVGVDDASSVTNDDMTTEHFITMVGTGEDQAGKYFLFYDNAVSNTNIGTSDKNKLYCQSQTMLIEGKGDPGNTYLSNSGKKRYTVSQVRETK